MLYLRLTTTFAEAGAHQEGCGARAAERAGDRQHRNKVVVSIASARFCGPSQGHHGEWVFTYICKRTKDGRIRCARYHGQRPEDRVEAAPQAVRNQKISGSTTSGRRPSSSARAATEDRPEGASTTRTSRQIDPAGPVRALTPSPIACRYCRLCSGGRVSARPRVQASRLSPS